LVRDDGRRPHPRSQKQQRRPGPTQTAPSERPTPAPSAPIGGRQGQFALLGKARETRNCQSFRCADLFSTRGAAGLLAVAEPSVAVAHQSSADTVPADSLSSATTLLFSLGTPPMVAASGPAVSSSSLCPPQEENHSLSLRYQPLRMRQGQTLPTRPSWH